MSGGTHIGQTSPLTLFHQRPWFMTSQHFSIFMEQQAIMKEIYGYLYDVGTPFAEAIWDTGGIDTLNFGEFGTDLKISLKEGSYSTIPFSVANPNDESVTRDWSMDNNLGISFGAVIENATGGSGNDIIIGNSADNTLLGGAGDDLIFLSGGSRRCEWWIRN